MSSEKPAALVFAIARDPRSRRRVAAALGSDVRVCELSPAELERAEALVDAAGAVAVLGEGDDLATVDALAALATLPAGAATTLVVEGAPDAVFDAALTRLAPAQVLSSPAPERLLRYAVLRSLPSPSPGRGARPNQRRAPALLGVSRAIRGVLDQVRQIAPSRIPALILGETGTGKELVARAIHDCSPRAGGPFVALNCGALPDALLESELFGHRKGAFTGATRDKTGLFELADGGTIFLDEIGDTSPAFQVKLLRVLEGQEIRRVGDTRAVPVDVRLVSATHQDLEAAVEEGRFREDLYYRIHGVAIYVPPLRRRRVDIPFLAQHFAEEFGEAHARRMALDEDFLEALSQRDFPGNVRELRNAVERAIALAAPDEPVSARHLGGPGRSAPPETPASTGTGTLRERVDRLETQVIRETLEQCGGSRSRAAATLGLSRQGLRYKMRRLGLRAR